MLYSKILPGKSFTANDHQAYDTHLNYIKCLDSLLRNVSLAYKGNLNRGILPYLDVKKNLISLTKKSLSDECKIVRIDEDYSYASTSWLPIKSYYLIFNVLLTIEYVLKLQRSAFKLGHSAIVDEFTRKLKYGEIEFSEPILNQVFDHTIFAARLKSGANLSGRTTVADMYWMAIRKIANYKFEDWKIRHKIDKRKPAHR
jgi:hypothetical protein